mgnify:CR=1 FL=1
MKVFRGYVSDYVRGLDPVEVLRSLSVFKRLLLRLLGYVTVEKILVVTPGGTRGVVPIYLAKCFSCGELYVDYPHGYDRYVYCPRCGARIYV